MNATEQPAKREHKQTAADIAAGAIARASAGSSARLVIDRAPATSRAAGVDTMDFVREGRIHIKHGSLFVDPYLVIHPRELDPKNEAKLRAKLNLTYSINSPSFYESPERRAIALNLGQLVPVSLEAKRSALLEEVRRFNSEVDAGADAHLVREDNDKHHPFASIVRDTISRPKADPVGTETLKNGLSVYLLVREKLTQKGYLNRVSDYVLRAGTPDQVLSELSDKTGIAPLAVREAALKGGLDGIGQLLGLDPAYVNDVKALTEYAATQDFGYNLIEHWHLGRQLLGVQAPIAQKIATGMDARITAKIASYRAQVRHHYDVPATIHGEEKRIAEALNFVEPIQRALMHKLGYEICFSPEVTADDIAFHRGVYGLHRKAANDLRDARGTYRIYFSGKGDLKGSIRTLVHEVAHNLWPEQFSPGDVAKIDALAASDRERFNRLDRMLEEKFPEFEKFVKAYQAGNDKEKAAIIATAKDYFKPYGVSVDEGLLPYLSDAREFRFMVKHAVDTLSVEGGRYNRSGYDRTDERFREVISRFAELKQVEHRGEPQLLHYLAPGLDQIFEAHYLPHLNRVYQQLEAREKQSGASNAPVTIRDAAAYTDEPKVEQRPAGTPVRAKATAQACAVDSIPGTVVQGESIVYNKQTLAALNTLDAMGVHLGR
jgi:hypothetical protein